MENIDEATQITIDLAKLLISTMQSKEIPWHRAFVRFQMADDGHCRCNGSYETSTDVKLFSALSDGKHLYHSVNELGPRLRQTSSNKDQQWCVFLLIVDSDFNYDIKFEYNDIGRWNITKLDGASGIPAGWE